MDIYRDGYGDALDNTLNQYNMSVSLYKGQVEQNKIFYFRLFIYLYIIYE